MRSIIACDFTDKSFSVQVGELVPADLEPGLKSGGIIQIIFESDSDALNIVAEAKAVRMIVDTLSTALAERMLRIGQNAPGTDIPQ